jgi:hypothetical protein
MVLPLTFNVRAQLLAQKRSRPAQPGFCGFDRDPENPGSLLGRFPFHVPENEDQAILNRELQDRLVEELAQFLVQEQVGRCFFPPRKLSSLPVVSLKGGRIEEFEGFLHCPCSPAALFHQAVVRDDGIQPRAELGLPVEAVQFPVDVYESVLQGLRGLIAVPAHFERKPIDGVLIATHQIGKGLLVPRLGGLNEGGVRPLCFPRMALLCDAALR